MIKPKKRIVLAPLGGLCNRMRSIASAYALSKATGSILKVLWEIDELLNAGFFNCFEPLDQVKIENVKPSKNILKSYLHQIKYTGYQYISKQDIYAMNDHGWQRYSDFDPYFEDLVARHKRLFIETDFDFYSHTFDIFKPISQLTEIIHQHSPEPGSPRIGLHIRRTDHRQAIQKSSDQKFVQVIEHEINSNPETVFFLATDSPEVENFLLERFGSRIKKFSVNKSRNDPAGIQEAIIDLYLLSKSRKIYGSYWSSFSETAAKIGQCPLIVVE